MDLIREKLVKKGWSQRDVEETIDILAAAEGKKSRFVGWLDDALIWISLLIAIVGNFLMSVVLVPFLLILSGGYLYAILLASGVAFGTLFTVILKAIEEMKTEKHIITGVFIPVFGLINMYIIARLSNKLITVLQLKTSEHSPALVSMIYVFAFILPFLISQYGKVFSKKAQTPAVQAGS